MRIALVALLCAAACGPASATREDDLGPGHDGGLGGQPDLRGADLGALAQPDTLGATPLPGGGVRFSVWAPNAQRAFVAGTWNGFGADVDELASDGAGGFVGTVAAAHVGDQYRFALHHGDEVVTRNDPRTRAASGDARSVVVDPRAQPVPPFVTPAADEQVIYELHVGTFHRPDGTTPGTFATATQKLDHLAALGVTMIELMPVHEFGGSRSWGYNPALPFAIARTYGTPDELRAFVTAAHARGIGVVVDVVHNHYNGKSLLCYDGECPASMPNGVYFYGAGARATTLWGPRPDFSRAEVRQYIFDNALMWLDEYGADGLRWDSVSNIRATDNGAGAANPEGAAMLATILDGVHQRFPRAVMIAEDLATIDPVTAATKDGGLGFDAQWDAAFFHPIDDTVIAASDSDRHMGAIADALRHRYNDRALSRVVFSESHDEVANGKARIPERISPGDAESLAARKRSTLAAAIVMTAPGVPMIFQGQELLTTGSFDDVTPLDWTRATSQAGILALYTDLIHLRRNTDGHTAGLRGGAVDVFHVNDGAKVVVYRRAEVIVLANFSATDFATYEIGLPAAGTWQVRFDSDDQKYGADFGGKAQTAVTTVATARDGFAQKASLALPAYSAVILSQ